MAGNSEQLLPREVKALRRRLQGRVKLGKKELTKLPKCELCGARAPLVPGTGMCRRCVYGE